MWFCLFLLLFFLFLMIGVFRFMFLKKCSLWMVLHFCRQERLSDTWAKLGRIGDSWSISWWALSWWSLPSALMAQVPRDPGTGSESCPILVYFFLSQPIYNSLFPLSSARCISGKYGVDTASHLQIQKNRENFFFPFSGSWAYFGDVLGYRLGMDWTCHFT